MLGFLQSAVLPLNLLLLFLVLLSLNFPSAFNLWLGFLSGLLLAVLQEQNIGQLSLVFVTIVWVLQYLQKLPLFQRTIGSLVLGFLAITSVSYALNLFGVSQFDLKLNAINVILYTLIFFLIKFSGNNFSLKPDSKLKLR